MKPKVGVVGLGIMGGAMAEALLAEGYEVVGFDLGARDVAAAAQRRGKPLGSTRAVADAADVVIIALATVAALEDAQRRSRVQDGRAAALGSSRSK